MRVTGERVDLTRAPKQARSQQRVELILDATKTLILQKGCASLKMTEIAQQAGVTIGSIYQYFPNKHAIIAGLAQHYLDLYHQAVVEAFRIKPLDLDHLAQVHITLLYDYYEMHRQEPVVRNIWMGAGTDKQFKTIDENDAMRNLELIFARSSHLFKPEHKHQAKLALLLYIRFGATAVATAVALNEKEGRAMMRLSISMLHASWERTINPLGIALT